MVDYRLFVVFLVAALVLAVTPGLGAFVAFGEHH